MLGVTREASEGHFGRGGVINGRLVSKPKSRIGCDFADGGSGTKNRQEGLVEDLKEGGSGRGRIECVESRAAKRGSLSENSE